MTGPILDRVARKGRGAVSNITGRFESRSSEAADDGWDKEPQELAALQTTVLPEKAKSIISRNQSPDISFSQSINPYRGCEHGCIYCYARPAHAYVNLSPGLDFETKLFYKENAAGLLEQELRKPGYECSMISLGSNTDPYQPIERKLKVTRSILEVLDRYNHPVGIVTKGATLLERDLDILASMAKRNLAMVFISVASLNDDLKRTLEPRTSGPAARLRLMKQVAEAGIPVGTMFAPVIPFINDSEMEAVLEAARDAGASWAGYVMLRLPHEVAPLFREWLTTHAPLKAEHVMSLVQQMRGGKDYSSEWGTRHRGEGAYAGMIAQRFQLACKRLGLNRERRRLSTDLFLAPEKSGDQMKLFS